MEIIPDASRAPGEQYPYRFEVVDDKTINAFALPGGFLYVNRVFAGCGAAS